MTIGSEGNQQREVHVFFFELPRQIWSELFFNSMVISRTADEGEMGRGIARDKPAFHLRDESSPGKDNFRIPARSETERRSMVHNEVCRIGLSRN